MKHIARVLVSVATALAPCGAAHGCKVSHVGTAGEIVEEADTIVRATAMRSVDTQEGHVVVFEVREVLKGTFASKELVLPGDTDSYQGRNERPIPYDFVRRGGRGGSCFARDYLVGREFLMILQEGSVAWAPLAATNEEVSGADDPWVWWVKGYLAGRTASTEPAK